jgi:hypothetical protein
MIFDEAALAYNVIARNLAGLIGPLNHEQMAPVVFLWAAKLSIAGLGVSEWALRLTPFLASLATLILFNRLAARVLSPWPAVLATLLIALSTEQIHYAAIFKQYSVDVLVTTLLLWLALACYRTTTVRRWWVTVAAGAVCLVVSMPSLFVLGGIGLAMIGVVLAERNRRLMPQVAAGLVVWLVAFGLVFLQTSQNADRKAFFQWWWKGSFLDPRLPGFPHRLSVAVSETLHAALAGPSTPTLVMALLIAGIGWGLVTLVRRRAFPLLVTLAVPAGLMAAASALHFYPIAARFVLFLAPCVVLAIAIGVDEVARRTASLGPRVWSGLVAGSALFATVPAAWQQATARTTDETTLRPLIQALEARSAPSETVYLYSKVVMVYVFYSTDWSDPPNVARADRFAQLFDSRWSNPPGIASTARAAGDALRLTDRGRGVVIGLGTGKHYMETRGFQSSELAPDWAANEVRRIRAEGSSVAWLLFGQESDSPREDLLREIQLAGATVDLDLDERGAHLYRVHFPR